MGQVVLREGGVNLTRLEEIGRRLAESLTLGDLVLLYGPLGAGKTSLVGVIARALRATDPVRSPSFTIANVYSGPITIQHLDLYRIEALEDNDALALEEYERNDAVTLVEWPDAGLGHLGTATWIVRLNHETLRERSIEIEAGTPDARERWERKGRADV